MYTMGVDVGSASSKVVILKDGKDVVAAEVVQVGTGSSGPQRALEQAYKVSGLTREDISYLVVTGYGRFAFEGADKQISEISCHAKGIYHLIPTARTIIDIGGQDAKAIRLDSKGGIRQFFMNDKCAAGTGRFLEVMARVLETTLDQMAELDAQATDTAPISNTCTVFAESEVISQLSAKVPLADIAAGIHNSVAKRVAGMALRLGRPGCMAMSGGVALNTGVVRAMEREMGCPILVDPLCQSAGAIGAAVLAYEKLSKSKE